MIAIIPGNFLEEFIQDGGHVSYRNPLFFPQIFLFEDKARQGRAQKLNSWLVELANEDLGIEIGRILPVLTTPP